MYHSPDGHYEVSFALETSLDAINDINRAVLFKATFPVFLTTQMDPEVNQSSL